MVQVLNKSTEKTTIGFADIIANLNAINAKAEQLLADYKAGRFPQPYREPVINRPSEQVQDILEAQIEKLVAIQNAKEVNCWTEQWHEKMDQIIDRKHRECRGLAPKQYKALKVYFTYPDKDTF